jgi:hypothetical protein
VSRTSTDDDSENPEEIVSSVAEEVSVEQKEEDNASDLARKTRAELEDLDDLDI